MPPHPFNACLSHVIAAGLKNIRRLNLEGKTNDVQVEVEHIIEVEHILEQYCLYFGTDRYDETKLQRYFHVSRLAYKAKANPVTSEMMIAWESLAPDPDLFRQQEADAWWAEWRKHNACSTRQA